MKRVFLLYTLLSLVGCTKVTIENMKSVASKEYYATIEERTSRTYVDEQIRMRWTAEDYVTVFTKNTYNRTFMFTGKTGDNAGGFRQTSVDDPYWFGYDVANSYAVYPHSVDNKLDETNLFLTLNMPAEQTYAENSFGLGANTMVAVSDNNQLIFKNVGSYLRVRLYGTNTSVSSITLTNKGNEAIAGAAKVTPAINGDPTCVMTGSGKNIRLTCPTPVPISSDANAPTDFWLVVPPVTLASGFTVTVENSNGKTQAYDVNQSFTFERNKYNNMVRELEIEDTPTVHVTEAGTLATLIPENKVHTITDLKISGELNGTDIKFIRENMIGCTLNSNNERLGSLKALDLSDATIVEGGEAYYTYFNSSSHITTENNILGERMFNSSKTLESIILPKNITRINFAAFHACQNLSNVIIFGDVKSIGQNVFTDCFSLNEIIIPEGVETIEKNAFYWTHLKSVTIPQSVTRIGDMAFYGNGGLNIYIKDLQKFIKACTSDISGLSIFANGGSNKLFLNNTEVNDLIIPAGITEIPSFIECSSLTSVTLPEGAYCKYGGTFQNCKNLKEAKFPNSCQIIPPGTFADSGLTTMIIGNNVTTIYYGAFSNCPINKFYSYTQTPPTIDIIPSGIDTSGMREEFKYSFGGTNKDNATLYVPKGYKEAYEESDWAKYFGTIVEMD